MYARAVRQETGEQRMRDHIGMFLADANVLAGRSCAWEFWEVVRPAANDDSSTTPPRNALKAAVWVMIY
jgi:hypothetical protein